MKEKERKSLREPQDIHQYILIRIKTLIFFKFRSA